VLSNEVLDEIFTWQETRKLSQSLSFNYQRQLFLITDTEETRLLAGQRLTVVELSDGTVQPRHAGKLLPLTRFGKDDAEITQGAIVSNKLLAGALQFIKDRQAVKGRTPRLLDCPRWGSGAQWSVLVGLGKTLAELRSIRAASVCTQQSIAKSHSVELHQFFALGDHALALCTDRFVGNFRTWHEGHERQFGFSQATRTRLSPSTAITSSLPPRASTISRIRSIR
jgi:hypothetical protein